MMTTVHKILIYRGSVIKESLLPIGQLSEEAAEVQNKHFLEYRFSRVQTLLESFIEQNAVTIYDIDYY